VNNHRIKRPKENKKHNDMAENRITEVKDSREAPLKNGEEREHQRLLMSILNTKHMLQR
jgi:hypothetical protein